MRSIALLLTLVAGGCQKGDKKEAPAPATAPTASEPALTEPAPEPAPSPPAAAAPDRPSAAPGRPASVGPGELKVVDGMAAFIIRLRDTVERNEGDCDKLAAALAPVMQSGKPILAEARALEGKLAGDQAVQEWVKTYVEEKTGGFDRVVAGLEGCTEHPGVQQALSGFLQ